MCALPLFGKGFYQIPPTSKSSAGNNPNAITVFVKTHTLYGFDQVHYTNSKVNPGKINTGFDFLTRIKFL